MLQIKKGDDKMRKWLKELRDKHNMSQQHVAEYLSVTRQYYNLIENGERQKDLDLSFVVRLAGLFDVSVDWIAEQEKKYKSA